MAGTKMTLRRSTRVTQSKTKKMQEILSPELFIRRESDGSGGEIMSESEESVDSCEEEMFAQGEDFLLHNQPSEDSDVDWEPEVSGPASKRHRRDDSSSSDEERRGGDVVASSSPEEEKWNGVDEPDITPPQPTFRPTYSPGPQLVHTALYTPLQIFQMFFSHSVLQTIARNTNAFGSTHHSTPSAPWVDVTVPDLLSYMSLVVFMGVVKCSAFTDYWRGGKLYNLQFPRLAMSGKKFLRICRPLHLSNPADDADNEQRRGTASFDRLAKIKPLYEEMREACKRNYHPYQEISIDERTVASKARVGLKRYMKGKPVRNGYKLFVLADSRNGYTWDFFVDQKKAQGTSGKGLSYDSVMALVDTRILGTGYKLYVDDFYTSPALFRDLLQKKIWACGTVRANRSGFPKTRVNGLGSESPRGSIRWIRRDSLLFVQWRDTRDVSLCSTVHTAHSDERVQRRSKGADGVWQVKDVSIPPAVKDYNRCMGGVDLSDALTGYYNILHKTQRWYKTFFYHFMDIAIVNSFLLHKEHAKGKGEAPLHQKAFRETLAEQMAEAGCPSSARPAPPAAPREPHHRLVHISGSSTNGRLKCRRCHAKTPVKCSTCNVPLCFIPTRDCYNDWHVDNKK